MINASGFTEVIFKIVDHHHDLLGLVIINSNALYSRETCYYYTIFQRLDIAILPYSICKLAALPKG